MGIQREPAAFVRALPLPKAFAVCELGDQGMCGEASKRLAKDWYADWGCGRYVSIDGNGRGTVTADLNKPILQMMGLFDLVTDFGTGEHIFDQAQVWKTLHTLTKPGGFIAFDRPSQGYAKHCFYLVTRGLIEDIAAANHYQTLWLDEMTMPRGTLIRGVFQRPLSEASFRIPQQGRYRESLVIPS